MSASIEPSQSGFLQENSHIEGKLLIESGSVRISGTIEGTLIAKTPSEVVLTESCSVQGQIEADYLYIDGFVRGTIIATTLVKISGLGRVEATIETPRLIIEPGAYFNGKCKMEKLASAIHKLDLAPLTTSPS